MASDNLNNTYLPTVLQQYVHRSRYARWLPELNRREEWPETVHRYRNFMEELVSGRENLVTPLSDEDMTILDTLESAILDLEVMPSMRAMMSAGPALWRDMVAGYNCAYTALDHPRAFDEALYILMCGTGVGFSCERQVISKLPVVPDDLYPTETSIVVRDSKMGWAKAYRQLVAMLYAGEIPTWDVTKVRPAGARLRTFGGRASGPAPLVDLFEFTIAKFDGARGRKLNSLECHDLMCKIGDIVVVGGVRRSALISLSNLSDQRMRDAKSGQWWIGEPQRALSNNSVAYTEKPEVGQWMPEWTSIYASFSGERGVFNREAAVKQCERFGRVTEINGDSIAFGTNPCAEIILRPHQFCNLTEVVARANDTPDTLRRKVELAAILGTFQSSMTKFRYLRKSWTDNSREERLLGVSMTGIMDCPLLNGTQGREERNALLRDLRDLAEATNKKWAEKLGIEPSAAVTCVKPSGTVSQLTDASSGIHKRHHPQYIRTVRNDIKDPLTDFMVEAGIEAEPDASKPGDIMVFSFPVFAPEGALCRDDGTAIDELNNWLDFKEHWCQHTASVTISVRDHEWPEVGAWVWNHFDDISGISFLPYDGGVYKQAPYQHRPVEDVQALADRTPESITWTDLVESDDETIGSQEYACTGGSCEIL